MRYSGHSSELASHFPAIRGIYIICTYATNLSEAEDELKVALLKVESRPTTKMSSPTLTAANRSSSRTRKETARFDPEDDTAAEIRAAAVAAAAAAAAAATANNPTATTMSTAAAVVAKKKRKAAVPSSSKPAKTKKKTTAASSVARQKNAPWTAAEDQRLRTIVAEEQRQRKGEAIRWTQVAEAHGGSRTAKQARERWLHVVDPGRKQGEWTEEETALVIRLQRELGNR